MSIINVWFQRIIRSKTMWFNAIVAGMAAIEPALGLLQSFLPGNVYAYLTAFLTVGNAMLRAVTTQPLSEK